MDFFSRVTSLFSSQGTDINARFVLLREAISGTMSKFHMARDKTTDKIVGLKLLDPEKTTQFEGRFTGLQKPSEGQIALALKHPRIVDTLEAGTGTDGRQYIVMEFLDGPGLNSLIVAKEKRLDGKRMELIRQMCDSVQFVHDQGYLHRDICPRNFIASKDLNSIKLIDFGLTVPAQGKFLEPGNRTGTPSYMAPEIVRRRPTDLRVDVFALGATIYHLCCFELPWPTQDLTGKAAMQHDLTPAVPILTVRPNLNPTLAEAIMASVAREPNDRPPSVKEFARMIRKVTHEFEK